MRLPVHPVHLAACLLAAVVLNACAAQAGGLTAAQAAQHVGERATVCGEIAGTHYAEGSKGGPTFINLDRPYPNPVFTVVVWGDYRGRFTPPPDAWTGRLCVTGRITAYHGVAEMKVYDPSQVRH